MALKKSDHSSYFFVEQIAFKNMRMSTVENPSCYIILFSLFKKDPSIELVPCKTVLSLYKYKSLIVIKSLT